MIDWRRLIFRQRWKDEKDMHKVIERILWQNENKRVVEGLIYEHKSLYYGEKEWKDSQQHLIGYHYFILQERIKNKWHDVEGFQGNIKDGMYSYFIYNKTPIEGISYNLSYSDAVKLFNKRNGFNFSNDLDEVKEKAKEVGIID